MLAATVLLAVTAAATPTQAHAWGAKGHEMAARIAVRSLPADMPAFFREAQIELGYLCPEPDRWRNPEREPTLTALATRDHWINLELVTHPLPPNRYDYLLQYAGRQGGRVVAYGEADPGFAPYAIAEHAEMLTRNFMLWRRAGGGTERARRVRRQIEQNIIHIAGLLSHFVTDVANPLHTTVHTNGWRQDRPNPNGFRGEEIHRRFETDYVNHAVEERDIEPLVARLEPVDSWIEDGMQRIRESHAHLERTYALDQATPFGEADQPAEGKRFTSERLADAASWLRDFWYAAWRRSADADP